MEGRLLFDFAGTAASNLTDFQCVRTHLSTAPGGSLESASRVFFEHARAGEGQFYDVLSLPPLWLLGLLRGRARAVCAKGLGIWDGLRGRRVTAERVEPGSSWLW